MPAAYITQDRVEREALALVRMAARTLDIASPWVEPFPVQKLLSETLPRIRSGELAVRLVYRVAEESDLRITDLAVLQALAAEGVQLRYSRRLHAKLVIADRERALVGSSNMTRRGGYGYDSRPEWRNEEGGVLLGGEAAVTEAAAHFDEIWEAADAIAPELLGVVMDFPTVREFRFIAIRDVAAGQLVAASDGAETTVVGEIAELTTYNESFPQMTEEMFLTQGYRGAAGRRVNIPDLAVLPSGQGPRLPRCEDVLAPGERLPLARVRVLREVRRGRPVGAAVPIAPGSDVRAPAPAELRALLGDGDVRLGRMQHHPAVGVWLGRNEIMTKHLAVLGMTGSGKSNAVKHLLRALAASRELRAFVVDTHGEYAALAAEIDPQFVLVDVSIPDKIDLLDWEMVKERFSVDRMTSPIKNGLRNAGRQTRGPEAFALALAASTNDVLQDIAAAVSAEPGAYCVGEEEPRIVHAGADEEADLAAPGLYVLDLRETETFEVRSKKCAVLARRVFADAKRARGERPALVVVDEAHNYVPERTTGYMAEAARRGSLGALTTLAVEGRKFNVGLVVVSQRPSRIAKDVLAQANSQLVFRLANLEDLQYVRESFEAAGEAFLADLPHLDTGVCICAGTMVAMPVRCDVALFARRRRYELGPERPGRALLERAVEAAFPEAVPIADAEELVVFAGPEAEVTIRAADGGYALDVDCADEGLAERVRQAVAEALVSPEDGSS